MAAKLSIYRTYRWIDKDPLVDALRTIAQDEKIDPNLGHQISGLAKATIDNWFSGETRRPQNGSSTAFAGSLGYVRHDKMRRDGTIEVAFEKARALDYAQEIEKQADWILKRGTKKKPRKRKKKADGNGHA